VRVLCSIVRAPAFSATGNVTSAALAPRLSSYRTAVELRALVCEKGWQPSHCMRCRCWQRFQADAQA
jgi:hypothetical protein